MYVYGICGLFVGVDMWSKYVDGLVCWEVWGVYRKLGIRSPYGFTLTEVKWIGVAFAFHMKSLKLASFS